jgi:transcriptional regulator with XRE-family HTH domain
MTTTIHSVGLRARTLELVKSAPRAVTYTVMAEACGLSVSWISRFASNKIDNPGVDSVQTLHDYLANLNGGSN